MEEYPFLYTIEENDYKLFPANLENDAHIFFHGTAEKNLCSIIKDGFRISGNLPSVSFANSSSLSLNYACNSRSEASPEGVVIAVRYEDVTLPYFRVESFGLHVDNMENQPTIVGFCVVPANYVYA
jgi:hypothetical protein